MWVVMTVIVGAGSVRLVTVSSLPPHVVLSARAHERQGLHRHDDDWLAARWAAPDTLVLVVRGNRLRAVDGRVEWISAKQAPEGERVLLGEYDGRARFAVLVDDRETGDDWVGLRAVVATLVDDEVPASVVLHAIGLAEWRWSTRYCPRCGTTLEPRAAGHELHCPGCGRPQFPRTDAAVIMAVVHGEPGSPEERLLLARGAGWPEGRYSTLAGFLEPGETLEDAVRREVAEETGVAVGEVSYYGNQPWPLPASLMLGFTARAETDQIEIDPKEITHARWFTRAELKAAYDDGTLLRPAGVSISRSLVEHWYGESLGD